MERGRIRGLNEDRREQEEEEDEIAIANSNVIILKITGTLTQRELRVIF